LRTVILLQQPGTNPVVPSKIGRENSPGLTWDVTTDQRFGMCRWWCRCAAREDRIPHTHFWTRSHWHHMWHQPSGYLPAVQVVGHAWDCELNGNIIATISTSKIKPKTSEVVYSAINHMHFIYHSASYW